MAYLKINPPFINMLLNGMVIKNKNKNKKCNLLKLH